MVDQTSIKNANIKSPSDLGRNTYTTIDLPKVVAGRPSNYDKVEAENIAINAFLVIGLKEGEEKTLTWANSALANTRVVHTWMKPVARNQYYVLTVKNPSTVTDITAVVYHKKKSIGGAAAYSYLTTLSFPKTVTGDTTYTGTTSRVIEFPFVNDDMVVVFSNDTVLGGSDGFSGYALLEILI